MSEPSDYQAWVVRAEEDYALCRAALRRKVPLLYGATFHAQQCAEKYLKALLVAHGYAFPRTHDLVALHELCIQASLPVRMEADQLDRLNGYAVQVRYLGDDPTLEEAQEAVAIAQAVRRWVRVVFRSLSREQGM
jgi:HEPN domain-containing protein